MDYPTEVADAGIDLSQAHLAVGAGSGHRLGGLIGPSRARSARVVRAPLDAGRTPASRATAGTAADELPVPPPAYATTTMPPATPVAMTMAAYGDDDSGFLHEASGPQCFAGH